MIDEMDDRESLLAYVWYVLRGNPLSLVGALLVMIFVVAAIFAPLIAPYGATVPMVSERLQPPSWSHLMGTDHLGMDIFSRVVFAARVDLFIVIGGVLLAMVVGVPLGAILGYSRPLVDEVSMRIFDGINDFPMLILSQSFAAALGRGIQNVVLVVAFVNFSVYLRVVRGQFLSLRQKQFTEAARCVGNSAPRIMFKHLLPNAIGPVVVLACLNSAWTILMASSLSFLGVGVPLPTPEWGLMVSTGTRYIVSGEWWISFFPGLAIALVVLGFNLMGDSLEDILDPRRRFR